MGENELEDLVYRPHEYKPIRLVGYYCHKNLCLGIYEKKPSFFARLRMRLFLGWKWEDEK